ncbi:TetR family transcriptional regulator [Mycobacterium sp. BK558]|jgi:AcrR family transcriptional regulator|uniref:HTH-type transcriptional regulator AcrR n=1 Tax=Mycolicibacterium chlorophenolicum TaxID=37916 RepID=A0A0J6VDD0_9MYCO|nr:TetR/AcrR family transcriptional regulator [Mycolicibacterium chlorophenolicum]KMO67528.1 HTH-type transcriptional regulator AcrR [Mycolicibacterium chlorophenolicum]MBI5341423.1 TetR/AcrR family transcriptional regulator [Mycolicibacterium rufum]RZT25821.1 TetR family transcriptional regulator [Mycobacterium sp. BK558]
MAESPTQRRQQGAASREQILDVSERLMAARGYAGTSISDIRRECGLPASSIYWHFGSKDGVLAAVMERGAERFFAQIPRRAPDGADGPDLEERRSAAAKVLAEHPEFLRLTYILALERIDDPAVAAAVRRVRDKAITGFCEAIAPLLPADVAPDRAERIVAELGAFAVAVSDGVFFADHLEPDSTDVDRMYRRLFQAVEALIPILLEEQ